MSSRRCSSKQMRRWRIQIWGSRPIATNINFNDEIPCFLDCNAPNHDIVANVGPACKTTEIMTNNEDITEVVRHNYIQLFVSNGFGGNDATYCATEHANCGTWRNSENVGRSTPDNRNSGWRLGRLKTRSCCVSLTMWKHSIAVGQKRETLKCTSRVDHRSVFVTFDFFVLCAHIGQLFVTLSHANPTRPNLSHSVRHFESSSARSGTSKFRSGDASTLAARQSPRRNLVCPEMAKSISC